MIFCAALWLGAPPADAIAPAPEVHAEDAWIRWLPAGIPAGGYLTIHNKGAAPVTLVGAESAAYGEISLHATRMQSGVAQMLSVGQIVIGPHATLNFAVAGYHMMLMQPTRPVNPGDRVPIVLRFADGTFLKVEFVVRRPDGG